MKRENVVEAVMKWSDGLIDAWFPLYLRPTIKTMLKANQHKLFGIIDLFTDANGNILINELIEEYINLIPEDGLMLNAMELFGDNIVTRNISIKVLERSDMRDLKQLLTPKK
jgi:hypothetical protein